MSSPHEVENMYINLNQMNEFKTLQTIEPKILYQRASELTKYVNEYYN